MADDNWCGFFEIALRLMARCLFVLLGVLLYYNLSVDYTISVAINKLAKRISKPTESLWEAV